MEHKLILGGEHWLPFARSRIKALRALGAPSADQRFEMPDGARVSVRVQGGHEYIYIEGGARYACLLSLGSDSRFFSEGAIEDTRGPLIEYETTLPPPPPYTDPGYLAWVAAADVYRPPDATGYPTGFYYFAPPTERAPPTVTAYDSGYTRQMVLGGGYQVLRRLGKVSAWPTPTSADTTQIRAVTETTYYRRQEANCHWWGPGGPPPGWTVVSDFGSGDYHDTIVAADYEEISRVPSTFVQQVRTLTDFLLEVLIIHNRTIGVFLTEHQSTGTHAAPGSPAPGHTEYDLATYSLVFKELGKTRADDVVLHTHVFDGVARSAGVPFSTDGKHVYWRDQSIADYVATMGVAPWPGFGVYSFALGDDPTPDLTPRPPRPWLTLPALPDPAYPDKVRYTRNEVAVGNQGARYISSCAGDRLRGGFTSARATYDRSMNLLFYSTGTEIDAEAGRTREETPLSPDLVVTLDTPYIRFGKPTHSGATAGELTWLNKGEIPPFLRDLHMLDIRTIPEIMESPDFLVAIESDIRVRAGLSRLTANTYSTQFFASIKL